MIALNQWVEVRKVQVSLETTLRRSDQRTMIDVNLAEQTLAVYDNNRMVFATMIATGQDPFWTRPGLHSIYKKIESETMRNNDPSDFYYLEKVPWIMYFDGARLARCVWRTRFGCPSPMDVFIHRRCTLVVQLGNGSDWVCPDPSGQTPTDRAVQRHAY
jgi:hypothetical protein